MVEETNLVSVPYVRNVCCSSETNIKMWQSKCKSKALSHIMHFALDVVSKHIGLGLTEILCTGANLGNVLTSLS